ncbi:MAG TPA: hypothetical protein VID04_17595 [Methylomirabilota bacterium]
MSGASTGLCETCRHARPVTSARGSTFWRCALSDQDSRFPKYPRLPVLTCDGFVRDEREARPGSSPGGRPDRA